MISNYGAVLVKIMLTGSRVVLGRWRGGVGGGGGGRASQRQRHRRLGRRARPRGRPTRVLQLELPGTHTRKTAALPDSG